MAVSVRRQAIVDLTRDEISRFTQILGTTVRRRAQRLAPVLSGRLSRTITQDRVRATSLKTSVSVRTNTGYGLYVEEGTGIYGPKNQVIRPRRAPFLVFQPKGLNHVIRVRSVRGQPGQHYMRDALLAVVKSLK
jgi:hypothetical protein